MKNSTQPKFSLGQIVATPGVLEAVQNSGQEASFFIDQHVVGNWGDVGQSDWRLNDEALITGERVLSAYKTLKNVRIWIITEADRSSTCVLLPEEY